MNWKNIFIASLAGGAAMALLSNIPILSLGNCLLCLWVWGGGILGAWVYKRLQGSVTTGEGAWIGALAGLMGGLISAFFMYLGASGLSISQVSSLLPAEYQVQFDLESLIRDTITTIALLEVLVFIFVGAIGGLIGGAILRNKEEQALDLINEPRPVVTAADPLPVFDPEAYRSIVTPEVEKSEPEPEVENETPPAYPPAGRTFTPPPQPRPLERWGENTHEAPPESAETPDSLSPENPEEENP